MNLKLYQQVALCRDLPEHQLRKGDLVTLIDRVPHPTSGEDGYILEVFNAIGESIAVLTVLQSAVEPLRSHEILTVRSLAEVKG